MTRLIARMPSATGRYRMLGALLVLSALASALSPSDGLASDTEQLLRIEKVIEFDREKLAELTADVSKRQEFFDRLADGIGALEGDLAQRKARLGEVAETGDSSERSTLQAEISALETELELFQTQSELAFSSLTTTREQTRALEKKLEREQRALDALRGAVLEEGEVVGVVELLEVDEGRLHGLVGTENSHLY